MRFFKNSDGKIMMDQADWTVALLAIASIILVTLNSCIIDACNWQLPLLQLYTSNTVVSLLFFPVVFYLCCLFFPVPQSTWA